MGKTIKKLYGDDYKMMKKTAMGHQASPRQKVNIIGYNYSNIELPPKDDEYDDDEYDDDEYDRGYE